MPLPASGNGRLLGQKTGQGKVKSALASTHHDDSNFTSVTYKKNKKSSNTLNEPVSPNLQHIITNHPVLNINNEDKFTYDNSMATCDTLDDNSIIDNDVISSSPKPDQVITNTTSSHSTLPVATQTKLITDQHLKHFEPNFEGTPVIIIELNDTNTSTWHPLKWAKLLSTNFFGINNIKPNGHKKVKVTFDSTYHANICLDSPLLAEHNLSAYIPSTLIFSYGVIKLDTSFSEEDFLEGAKCVVPIIGFKRIVIHRDGNPTPTRIVEIKFLSTKIPKSLSIFNVLFDVSPSVRSPLQCNKCLRFGHTHKFCRSSPRCSHCGENKHSIDQCPSVQATDPRCLFCHLPHLATDRNCQEWDFQRDIKKIMATENISFRDAINFKKQNQVSSAFSYSNIVNKQPMVSSKNIITPPPQSNHQHSPNVTETNYTHFHSPRTSRHHSPPRAVKHFKLPTQKNFSLPNGSFLEYVHNSHSINEPPNQNNDLTWVNTLAINLTQSLINAPLNSQTASSLQNLIFSSLLALLALPGFPTISLP